MKRRTLLSLIPAALAAPFLGRKAVAFDLAPQNKVKGIFIAATSIPSTTSIEARLRGFRDLLSDTDENPNDYSVILTPLQEIEFLKLLSARCRTRRNRPAPTDAICYGRVLGFNCYRHANATSMILVRNEDLSRVFAGLSMTPMQADVANGILMLSRAEAERMREDLTIKPWMYI